MTVSSEVSSVSYAGNGATQIFAVPYYFLADTHLRVILRAADGTETVQAITTNYTVSGAGNPAGGSITMLIAPASGVTVVIIRNVPATQETDYVANDPFPAESHERALDKLTMLVQQGEFNISRAIRVPDSDPVPSLLPAAQERNTTVMGFDSNGNPIVIPYTAGDSVTLAALLASQAIGTEGSRLVGYTGRTVYAKLSDYISVSDYGAVGDGVTDDTAAFENALATLKPVYIPAGTFLVKRRLVVNPGQILFGAGRKVSTIYVDATFDLVANGIIRLAIPGESVTAIRDFGIFCYQPPSAASRAQLITYPPAVYADNCSRFEIDKIRIAGATDGVIATGNCGGAFIGRLEVGCSGTGVKFDGALDFVRIDSYHFWPFGYSSGNLINLFEDGTTVAAEFGRVDGLNIGSLATYKGRVKFTSTNLTNIGAALPISIANLQLDGEGATYEHTGGNGVQVACCYSTKASSPTAVFTVTNGRAEFGFIDLDAGNTVTPILVNGGKLYINGGRLNNKLVSGKLAEVTSGTLSISNAWLDVPNNTRTLPYIEQSGAGILNVMGCTTTRYASISGPVVKIGADLADHTISGNNFLGFSLDLPANANLGVYGPNRSKSLSFTPVVNFTTNGDFAPTYTVQQGRYWYTDTGIKFSLRVEFNTNAYSTAAGTFRVAGLPIPLTNAFDLGAVSVGMQSRFALTGGFTAIQGVVSVANAGINLRQSGGGQVSTALNITNVPASTTGFAITLTGEIYTVA